MTGVVSRHAAPRRQWTAQRLLDGEGGGLQSPPGASASPPHPARPRRQLRSSDANSPQSTCASAICTRQSFLADHTVHPTLRFIGFRLHAIPVFGESLDLVSQQHRSTAREEHPFVVVYYLNGGGDDDVSPPPSRPDCEWRSLSPPSSPPMITRTIYSRRRWSTMTMVSRRRWQEGPIRDSPDSQGGSSWYCICSRWCIHPRCYYRCCCC